jgi:predicted transcriptional regulator
MTPDQFRAWREQLGLSKASAARALGISPSRLYDYEAGMKRGTDRPAPVPRVVELACLALELMVETDEARSLDH